MSWKTLVWKTRCHQPPSVIMAVWGLAPQWLFPRRVRSKKKLWIKLSSPIFCFPQELLLVSFLSHFLILPRFSCLFFFFFVFLKSTLIRHLWPRMSDRGEWLVEGFPRRILAMLTACETAPWRALTSSTRPLRLWRILGASDRRVELGCEKFIYFVYFYDFRFCFIWSVGTFPRLSLWRWRLLCGLSGKLAS